MAQFYARRTAALRALGEASNPADATRAWDRQGFSSLRRPPCRSCCRMPPVVIVLRRRCPDFTPTAHCATMPALRPDPPTIEEIVAVMRHVGDGTHGRRLRKLIVVLWRAGLHIHEALALGEADLDRRRGSLLVRRGKGGRRTRSGRFAPHQLRHVHAVEMAGEGLPVIVIQRQLGTPASALHRSTSKASTAPRSSTPSAPDARP